MRRNTPSTLLIAALVMVAGPAFAQEQSETSEPMPEGWPTSEDEQSEKKGHTESREHGWHRHDGFLGRVSAGGAYLADTISTNAGDSNTFSGGALIMTIQIGGTPAKGLVLGGAVDTIWAPSVSSESAQLVLCTDTCATDASINYGAIGPFLDYYFDDTEGLHVQAFAGIAYLSVGSNELDAQTENASGLALAAAVGHEWWVGDQYSLGVLGQFEFATLSDEDFSHRILSPSVLVTLTNQ